MGKYKTKKAAKNKKKKGNEDSGAAQGSLLSLRSGFKNLVGTDKKGEKKKESTAAKVINYSLIAACVVAIIYMLIKRGGC